MACAFRIASTIHSHRLRNSFSIFSAELTAILLCLQHILHFSPTTNKLLIISDSLSSLNSISDPYSQNPLTQRILIILQTLLTNQKTIVFLWIPSHIGEPLHDETDLAAKNATSHPKIANNLHPTHTDLKQYYYQIINKQWFQFWQNSQPTNKLRQIKKFPSLWSSSNRPSRREEIVVTRLRIGHTKLTHSYLISNLFPPDCPKCGTENLTIEHIFTCPQLSLCRSHHNIPNDRSKALCNSTPTLSNVISYLLTSDLFKYI